MNNIQKLKDLNDQLARLLYDPQPGLLVWKQMISDTLLEMADYAGYGFVSELVKKRRQIKATVAEQTETIL